MSHTNFERDNDFPQPPLPPARSSWERASRFRERLSQITIAPPTAAPVEKSQFSPDSPPPPPPRKSFSHIRMGSSSTTHLHRTPRNLEAGAWNSQSPARTGVMGKINALLAGIRNLGRRDIEMVQIQDPSHLGPWPPLHIEKRPHVCHCDDPKRKKRRRIWTIILIVVLFYLLANSIVLNTKVLTTPSTNGNAQANSSSGSTSSGSDLALSSDQQQCLTQFTVNAPSNPSSYPCGTCLPLLQAVPQSFLDGNAQDAQDIQNTLQFCGLKGFFDSVNSDGQQTLTTGGWIKDVKFCAWTGVSCDGSGRISTLGLQFPAVPASIPDAAGALTGLTSLQLIGNGQVPGGNLPSSFTNLTSMSALHLESTGMNALPDNLFSSMKSLKSLTLVKNNNFGGGLPSTTTSLSLQNLVINDQSLSTSLTTLFSSAALQKSLSTLDLTSTGLSTSIPSTISSFSALTELHLDDNNLQPPIPSAFPSTLQILTLSNNTALSGNLPSSLCSSTTLKTCTLSQTGLGQNSSCGPCTFS